MSSRVPTHVFASLSQSGWRQAQPKFVPRPQFLRFARPYSSEATQPPLFTKIKCDLKNAMKAKDTARLNVLRSVISAVNNASKTSSPIKTDIQLLALLRKTARSSQDAVQEFQGAGRQDLVDKEEAQIRVLEEYMESSGVESVGEEELRKIIVSTIAELKAGGGKAMAGDVSKKLFAPGGTLSGKDYDSKKAAEIVKQETS